MDEDKSPSTGRDLRNQTQLRPYPANSIACLTPPLVEPTFCDHAAREPDNAALPRRDAWINEHACNVRCCDSRNESLDTIMWHRGSAHGHMVHQVVSGGGGTPRGSMWGK